MFGLGAPELVFGSTKLPQLARSLGEAKKAFHRGDEQGTDVTP